MVSLKNYKNFSYIVLALVVIVSFAITNLLINLVVNDKISSFSIIFVILNLLLNFLMFFFVFRFAQQLIEKETALNELVHQIQSSKEIAENAEIEIEEKEFNVDGIIEQIIPASPQNMTIEQFTEKVLANMARVSELVQAVFYVRNPQTKEFTAKGKYAYYVDKEPPAFFEGESLPGQVAKDKKIININNVPQSYFTVVSGLGKSSPGNLLILPIVEKDETIGIIELATFIPYDKDFEKTFEKLSALIGKIIIKIK
jgi:transcriptional regulator with GAF, ATPase, and Fis domain